MTEYKTCTHTYDSGRTCKSAAAKDREYCGYHLHYRGRQMRMARYRARHQRFDITLPPLDSLCSIHSALSQVAEALAADMIDFAAPRAFSKLSALPKRISRTASKTTTPTGTTALITAKTPPPTTASKPTTACPKASTSTPLPKSPSRPLPLLSHRKLATAYRQLTTVFPLPCPPSTTAKTAPGCPEHTIRADYPETPELAELREIQATLGNEAMAHPPEATAAQSPAPPGGRRPQALCRHRPGKEHAPRSRAPGPAKTRRREGSGAGRSRSIGNEKATRRRSRRFRGGRKDRLSPTGRHG